MDNFIYSVPTKIYFGKDEHLKIGKLIKEYNPNKVLIHYGSKHIKETGLLDIVKQLLDKENIKYIELGGVIANPVLSLVYQGIEIGIREGVDFVLAIGGGSVLDSAKHIANGIANPDDDVWDYSLGKKEPLKTLKKAAILTISASGSEMSDSCVVTKESTKDKRGYSSILNRFDFSIENPELTYSVSKYQTACGAVDIAMHTIERYFNVGDGTTLTDNIALALIKTVIDESLVALNEPNNYDARANLMWASSLAHNSLTGLGRRYQLVVHQLELELSGLYSNIAHGAGLPPLWLSWARYVYKYNIPRWKKYAEVIWNTSDINKAIDLQEEYYKKIGMPTTLRELNVNKEDLELLAFKTSRGKTRKLTGDKELDYEDVLSIFKDAY